MTKILVGDLGGTKGELALYEEGGDVRSPLLKKVYPTRDFATAEMLLHRFLEDTREGVSAISLGVAGPVCDDLAQVTNLPWKISSETLKDEFQVSHVSLVNDLTAVCAGIPVLEDEDLLTLHEGAAPENDMLGVIAPGTGLGVGMIFNVGSGLVVRGTEGGHTDFAPVDDEQLALITWLRKQKNKEISSEMVCAGPAISDLYDFCAHYYSFEEAAWVTDQFENCSDRSPIIGEAAVADSPCPICQKAIELLFRIVGGEAANLALRINALGGIYFGGGILPRFVDKISFDGIVEAFQRRADRAPFMADIPLRLILRRDVALIGAARYGLTPDFVRLVG